MAQASTQNDQRNRDSPLAEFTTGSHEFHQAGPMIEAIRHNIPPATVAAWPFHAWYSPGGWFKVGQREENRSA